MSDQSIFAPTDHPVAAGNPESPNDPHFRWQGVRIDGERSPEAALRARRAAITTVEQYVAWLKSHGGVDFSKLTQADLEAGLARYRGETPGEKAVLTPALE